MCGRRVSPSYAPEEPALIYHSARGPAARRKPERPAELSPHRCPPANHQLLLARPPSVGLTFRAAVALKGGDPVIRLVWIGGSANSPWLASTLATGLICSFSVCSHLREDRLCSPCPPLFTC